MMIKNRGLPAALGGHCNTYLSSEADPVGRGGLGVELLHPLEWPAAIDFVGTGESGLARILWGEETGGA
ncbi:unnamed protein product [Ectocarpus fasciculatus]